MRKLVAGLLVLAAGMAACTPPEPISEEGGANANDRSEGGEEGERLLTGAMTTSPDGRYVIIQRNQTTVLLDVARKTAIELAVMVDRVVFPSDKRDVVYIVTRTACPENVNVCEVQRTVVAYDLTRGAELWRNAPFFLSPDGAKLAKLSADGSTLVLGDTNRVFLMSTEDGKVRGVVDLGTTPTDMVPVPKSSRVLLAGTVSWPEHKPLTRIFEIDVKSAAVRHVDVPNCHAPIEVLPDGSRAFMSPTFCEESKETRPANWTNPDPVSVLDLTAEGPRFVRNLPGFGPVAMPEDGSQLVAYLDRDRIDESLFDDKRQVPRGDADTFHLMTIDPRTLTFKLAPIGAALPRFALTRDGKALLVDASVMRTRSTARVEVKLSPDGLRVDASLFGGAEASVFGRFDLAAQRYQGFAGAPARLDRFVQTADGRSLYTLEATADGLGGELFRVDLSTGVSLSTRCSLRDIALLGDGKTLLLRIRRDAAKVATSANSDTFNWYRREEYCFSQDGATCMDRVQFQDSRPFVSAVKCVETHDCYEPQPIPGSTCF
jgi:hypothetical protein